jgi:hypothetical protein
MSRKQLRKAVSKMQRPPKSKKETPEELERILAGIHHQQRVQKRHV